MAFSMRSDRHGILDHMMRQALLASLLLLSPLGLARPAAHAEPAPSFVASVFASSLERSRNALRPLAAAPPPEIIRLLAPHVDAELLATVRYAIGDPHETGLARFAIRNGRAAAVTLIDTIVFADARDTDDLALWAHEIAHVEQFREWGRARFATEYLLRWPTVEADAERRAREIVAAIRR
jgi:hypothetical protein